MRSALVCFLAVACGGPQIQQRSANDLAKLGPATLEVEKPREGEPRTVKVRVWTDAGVRALPQWKENITEQLDYAGQLLTPLVGIALKVDAWKEWNRAGDPSKALDDLATADDGKEAIWVIGYTAAGDTASKAMSELGDAKLLGHHVVVHSWADKPETDALASLLPDLKPTERNEVIAAHMRHKQTVVLLHHLAVTLGAIGESDAAWIQNPAYSSKQKGFADRTRDLMQLAIDGRIADDADKQIAHVLLEKIDKEEWGGWIAGDKEQIATQLRAMVIAGKSGEAAADVPIAAMEQFDRVKAIAQRGDFATAMSELDNMLTAYPGNATLYLFKCNVMLRKSGPKDKQVLAACARAGELAPSDPKVHFLVGMALMQSKDLVGGHAELKLAADKLAKLSTGAVEGYKQLVALYMGMGALTWAEEVVAQAKLDKDPLVAEIAQTRARYGLPRGAKFVKPEDEGPLVATVKEGLSLVYKNKYAEAEKLVAVGEKKWPGAPGFAAVRCDLSLRQTQLEPARAACKKALAADPNQSWALYLSGVIALKNTSAAGTKEGIEKLRQAIGVDPELGQAWRTLAKAYKRAKDEPAYEKLAKDYATKFGTPLPP